MEEQFELTFEGISAALKEYAEEVRQLYRNRLILDDKYSTGKLIQNIKTDIKFNGTTIKVVLYLEDYWKYVEEGIAPDGKYKNPGWKAYPFILKWIEQKPITPEPDKNGKLPTTEQLAYLIGRKIVNSGITAGHQLKETVDEVNQRWLPRLQAALQSDFDGYVIKVFEKAKKLIKI